MRRRVVAPLRGVLVVVFIFGHEMLEERVQVRAGGTVRVFIDHERSARVLEENRRCAGGNSTGAHDALDGFGDFVSPLPSSRNAESVGVRFHVVPAANGDPPGSVNASILQRFHQTQ
jgi:hypothetical protein